MKNPKKKGNSFEITVARILSKWFDPKAKEDLFWRSASSGAQATMSRKFGRASNQDGDIKSSTQESMWVTDNVYIECKSYASFCLETLIGEKGNKVRDWWIKCSKEAHDVHKIPFLIFKRNGSIAYVMIDNWFVSLLSKYVGGFENYDSIRLNFNLHNTIMFSLHDFLHKVDPDSMKLAIEEWHK
jgi:hypothetical protein